MKKIVFCDIDRTLCVGKEISVKNKDMIKEYVNKGGLFILVSGRVIDYTKKISENINASNYIICTNGGVLYDYVSNKIIYKNIISYKTIKKLFDISYKYDCRLIFGGINTTYANKIKYPDRETKIDMINQYIYDNNPITQITISNSNINVLRSVIDKVNQFNDVKITNMHRSLYDDTFDDGGNPWIDISKVGTDKGKATIKLLEYLNINLKDSIRIGDDLNDMPMFFEEGVNVAVDNAIHDLKEKADIIAPRCEDDAVAKVLDDTINEKI